ncbi:hypothetical protein PSYMO_38518, partial [Pseudomonas amygdali pv. mori str. 301020]
HVGETHLTLVHVLFESAAQAHERASEQLLFPVW